MTIVLSVRFATADDRRAEEARQHFLKGQQLFEGNRSDEAASELEQAHAAPDDPSFI